MIENKELGVKFAESEDEAGWYNFCEEIKQNIEILDARRKRAEKDLKMTDREITMRFRNGAKALIKQAKSTMILQKEILKFAESKIKKS